jgi:hypothetical protein
MVYRLYIKGEHVRVVIQRLRQGVARAALLEQGLDAREVQHNDPSDCFTAAQYDRIWRRRLIVFLHRPI